MAKIFISFLGTGSPHAKADEPGYDVLNYRFEGEQEGYVTRFAQRAIIEKHGITSFDRICLMMTAESSAKHRDLLLDELLSIGGRPEQFVEDTSITTNQSTEQQWEWFDALQRLINDGDEVVFDFTHGFRSVPIIFSTAISFLQKVKQFRLLNAHYGYLIERGQVDEPGSGEIIDMTNFYRINEWADGVSRLVDAADASGLASLAEQETQGFAALNDPQLVAALNELTGLVKNIDVNHVAEKADVALKLVLAKREDCSGADRQLLDMVVAKFSQLAIDTSGLYDVNYFSLQLVLSEILIKHRLHMQAFTVMRECVASIGMLAMPSTLANEEMTSKQGHNHRHIYSGNFVGLCQYGKQHCRVNSKQLNTHRRYVLPFYERLEKEGIAQLLSVFVRDLSRYRNGFDHAWTSMTGVPDDVDIKARKFLRALRKVIEQLQVKGFFDDVA